MSKLVDKGAVIQTVTNAQLKRWAKAKRTISSTAGAKSVLTKKFGKSPIKAICPGKNKSFIVATSPTVKGKTFRFSR